MWERGRESRTRRDPKRVLSRGVPLCRLDVNRASQARLQEAPAERYVRQRVPGHRAELHDDAYEHDERSALGWP